MSANNLSNLNVCVFRFFSRTVGSCHALMSNSFTVETSPFTSIGPCLELRTVVRNFPVNIFDNQADIFDMRRAKTSQIKTLLIVDDDESTRLLLRFLGSHGYRILEAESGNRAIEILQTKELNDEQLHQEFYEIMMKTKLNIKEFFSLFYKIIISKEKGPKLASFIITIGKDKITALLKDSLEN